MIGGTGFVGRKTIEQLNRSSGGKLEIRALVRDKTNLPKLPNVTPVIGSLPDVPDQLFTNKPNIVIHFGTKNRDTDGSGFGEINVTGTRNLMYALPKSTAGVIYGSSFSVYGQGNLLNANELTVTNPETPLAVSRAKAETIILNEMEKRGRSAFVLRPRFIVGKDDAYTLPTLIKAYNHHLNVGSGSQLSTYIEVHDYAKIITRLTDVLFQKAAEGIYLQSPLNIGYRNPLPLKQLHSVFQKVFGYKRQFYIPVPKGLPSLLKKSGLKMIDKAATILELGAFSHSADVSLLEKMIGSDIIQKDPEEVILQLLSASDSNSFEAKQS